MVVDCTDPLKKKHFYDRKFLVEKKRMKIKKREREGKLAGSLVRDIATQRTNVSRLDSMKKNEARITRLVKAKSPRLVSRKGLHQLPVTRITGQTRNETSLFADDAATGSYLCLLVSRTVQARSDLYLDLASFNRLLVLGPTVFRTDALWSNASRRPSVASSFEL